MLSYMYQPTSLDTNNRDIFWLIQAEEEFIQGYCVAYKFSEKVGEADLGKGGTEDGWEAARTPEIHGTRKHVKTSSRELLTSHIYCSKGLAHLFGAIDSVVKTEWVY